MFFFLLFAKYFEVGFRRLCTYNVLNCTYGRPLRKIHERGPRCPEVRPRPPPMDEDGRRTAPMTIWDEPASEPAEVGGLGELNGGRMLQEQLKRVRQRVVHRDGTPFKRRRTILADNSDDGTGLLSDAQMIELGETLSRSKDGYRPQLVRP